MPFTSSQAVRFQHCDPAGIVFYPRYYEMLNATIEDWFAARLGLGFAEIHGPMGMGVPTVAQEARYHRPSRLGDRLDFVLTPTRLGVASLALSVEATCGGELRASFTTTLVWFAQADGRPRPWPEALRARIEKDMEGDAS